MNGEGCLKNLGKSRYVKNGRSLAITVKVEKLSKTQKAKTKRKKN